MPKPNLAQMISMRWKLYDRIEAIEAKAKAEKAPLAAALEKVENMIEEYGKANEIVSENTDSGGIKRAHQKWANIEDYDQFLEWILTQPNPKEAISGFIKHALKSSELHKHVQETNQVPPGVELGGKTYYQYKRGNQ